MMCTPAVKLELRHSLHAAVKDSAYYNKITTSEFQLSFNFNNYICLLYNSDYDTSSAVSICVAGCKLIKVAGGSMTKAGNANK